MTKVEIKKRYFDNGQMSSCKSYRNNKAHGPYLCWHEDGTPYLIAGFRDGVAHGPWVYFNDGCKFPSRTYHLISGVHVTEEEYRTYDLTEKLAGLND